MQSIGDQSEGVLVQAYVSPLMVKAGGIVSVTLDMVVIEWPTPIDNDGRRGRKLGDNVRPDITELVTSVRKRRRRERMEGQRGQGQESGGLENAEGRGGRGAGEGGRVVEIFLLTLNERLTYAPSHFPLHIPSALSVLRRVQSILRTRPKSLRTRRS